MRPPLPSIKTLVDSALFNILVGNCDAHGKNYSFLRDGRIQGLAPLYNLVSTTAYPELSPKLSMRVGKEWSIALIGLKGIEGLASDLGVRPHLLRERLDAFRSNAPGAWEVMAAIPELSGQERLVDRIRTGWETRLGRLST
ncbi:MAG: HipA domain-containing protein [Rectinemataceae bacterium]